MNKKNKISLSYVKNILKIHMWIFFIALALAILGFSVFSNRGSDVTALMAKSLEETLDKRMSMLEDYMRQVARQDTKKWPQLKDFPQDMVIYRYVNDSLKSWNNQFPIANDALSKGVILQRFPNPRYNIISPLSDADTTIKYLNIGPGWYLTKVLEDNHGCHIIGGLLVRDQQNNRTYNGINPKLKVTDRFAVHPISESGGCAVYLRGKPMMKIIQENAHIIPFVPNSWSMWLAYFLTISGILLFLKQKRSRHRMLAAMAIITIVSASFFLAGYGMRSQSDIFSPTVYADGALFFSLGAVLIINIWIFALIESIYLTRSSLLRRNVKRGSSSRMIVYSLFLCVLMVLLALHTHFSFKSLIFNSNINLELYQVDSITMNTIYVYVSYMMLFLCQALLLQMQFSLLRRATGLSLNMFTRTSRVVFSVIGALYFLFISTNMSFSREQGRAEIWANRLAVDRNLAFEIQLRNIEKNLSNDGMVPSLLHLDRDFQLIVNTVKENYLNRLSSEYDVDIYMFRDSDADHNILSYFNEMLRNGTPLSEDSRMVYTRSALGKSQYAGLFTFYTERSGVVRLLMAIENKAEYEGKGYDAVVDGGRRLTIKIPARYSFGKYIDGRLVSYKGDFAYPTILTGPIKMAIDDGDATHVNYDKYVHFVNHISDDEYIVISRRVNDIIKYIVAAFILLLLLFMVLSSPKIGYRQHSVFEKNFFKQRINSILLFSLVATLVSMAAISVLFIYTRNSANLNDLMAGKINTIQSLVEAESRYFRNSSAFTSNEFRTRLNDISNYTKSDITLYDNEGKVIITTFPEIFERMSIGTRLNGQAYNNLIYENRRYYIHKDKIDGHTLYTISAPLFDANGNMGAIVSSPYTDAGLGLRKDAIFHASFIFAVFFILFMLTRLVSAKMLDKMFRPIVEIGKRMKQARLDSLQYIFYDREDELNLLVDSYNRMVHDLSESSKQVAQIERDKAWSEMARQVAHEIKTPMTPIKLQIQRIIRLKSKNDPNWQEKFDSIVPVIMESIDRLTETANEFSTFAKLYSEPSVEINLVDLVNSQIMLFADKDHIDFDYIGLDSAIVLGPKPQLTRVLVNLLSNAVQSIEGMQVDSPQINGKIYVSVRNSNMDGYYDILIEDNGPGVKDENRAKLFTPNFTTKSSGTGLGLAICKNILDLCDAEITYSKSFSLGGACFLIRYPKN